MKISQPFALVVIFTVSFIALFMLAIIPLYGQTTGDERAYMPFIRRDLTPTPTPSPTPSCTYTPIDSSNETIENDVVNAIQAARRDANIGELNRLDNITAAARKHSQDMAENKFVGHQGSDSKYAPARLEEACYTVERDQEIVWGGVYSDSQTLINSWLEDPNWNRALLDDDMKDFGVGYRDTTRTETENTVLEDFFTVNLGYTIETVNRASSVKCEIELENEFGKGVLITSDPHICNNFYQK